ncbi:MAG: BNR-4 repeat-containing protein [Candidatus Solibacter usitatus]|nr:BNR-4 repeat-containing protein [Candidatus Solibacter usitatus]
MRLAVVLLAAGALSAQLPKDDGYRGIWYFNQPTNDEYVYKYSGGFATYPQQHAPIAVYAKPVNKTFFCYGGTMKDTHDRLVHMVSYFDHATGTVPRPTILIDKRTSDAHDNPTIALDDDGYVWVFSSAHGTGRPSFIHRSRKPYSVEDFERVLETNFSYTQPWHLPGRGFLFLHTRYRPLPAGNGQGRALYWMTSADGRSWSEPRQLAFAEMGHYQVSWPWRDKVGTAFDIHPAPVGLNARTNLYYAETRDMGGLWTTVDGRALDLPLTAGHNPALVRDFRSEGLLVYLKDLQYDSSGRPVVVYLTSKGYAPGPANGPYVFWTARWTGTAWLHHRIAEADHNYDHGSLYLESDSAWRFIAPTGAGPHRWSTGGEVEMWVSADTGATWRKRAALTRQRPLSHTYVRRPLNAAPGFYAIWADGDPLQPSASSLYFCDRAGRVFRLPAVMAGGRARPVRVR